MYIAVIEIGLQIKSRLIYFVANINFHKLLTAELQHHKRFYDIFYHLKISFYIKPFNKKHTKKKLVNYLIHILF